MNTSGFNCDPVLIIGQLIIGQLIFGQLIFGQLIFGQLIFGQLIFAQLIFGQSGTPERKKGKGGQKISKRHIVIILK